MTDQATLPRRRADVAFEGLAAVLERLPRSRPTLAVLTYHRVAPAASRPDLHPGLCVDPGAFAAQMQLVATRATPVDIDQILSAAAGGPALPARAVHITFDDAYLDIEEHAWPVLRQMGLPATMFVPTSYPDQARTFWWDRLHHAVAATPGPELQVGSRRWALATESDRRETFLALRAQTAALPHDQAMAQVAHVVEAARQQGVERCEPATSSWSGLRTMAAQGLALGAHSRHHPFLDRVDARRLDDEIAGSLHDLRQEVGPAARPVLAYPSGAFDANVIAATARADIMLGFTTERGVADLRSADWLRLPRINVGRRASTALLRIQLNPGPHTARTLAKSVLDRTRPGHRSPNRRTSWS